MHFIRLTIRAAASCSSEHRTLVNKPLKALLNNLGSGLLLPIRFCWGCKDLDINGNLGWVRGRGRAQEVLTIFGGLSELIKREDKWVAACNTLEEVWEWDRKEEGERQCVNYVLDAPIGTGMWKGWDLSDKAYQEDQSWWSSPNNLLTVRFVDFF